MTISCNPISNERYLFLSPLRRFLLISTQMPKKVSSCRFSVNNGSLRNEKGDSVFIIIHTQCLSFTPHTHTHAPEKRNINFLGTFCKYSVIFFLSLSFTKVLFSFSLDAMRWWQWWCWIEEGESKSAKRKKKYFNDKIHYVVVKLFRDLLFISCYFSISSLLVDFRLLVQRGGCCCVM